MRRKEQYADEIIEMLERTKGGAWASNINLNTKDRVIEVCQNVVDSWSGRKFKDHCTTPPQALEQTRWIPVSEKLPEVGSEVLVCYDFKGKRSVYIANLYGDGKFLGFDDEYLTSEGRKYRKAIAWMPLPQPYKGESEVRNETCD